MFNKQMESFGEDKGESRFGHVLEAYTLIDDDYKGQKVKGGL